MSTEIIDAKALERLLNVIGGDPDDLRELLDEFEATTPKTLENMQAAAAAGEIDSLRISTHSLKSNARDFGAIDLAICCEALESACQNGTLVDPKADVAQIAEHLDRARAALAQVPL